ncbi:unnamed protein product [Urochloa humidicola]
MARLPSCLLLVVVLFAAAATYAAAAGAVTDVVGRSDPSDKCVYTVYVRTGSIWKGGTDSKIGVTLLTSDGSGIRIADLERWGGLMGAGHDYYERGNLDIFSGRGPCMRAAPCAMNLTSDGTGPHHGWYCNYLEVTATGPHLGCAQQLFTVEQWLATDAPPYRLYSTVDKCGKKKRREEQDAAAGVTCLK